MSVTICPITSTDTATAVMRRDLKPDAGNGLHHSSRIMIDKVTTVPRSRLGRRTGALASEDLAQVDRALLVFLGLAS
jgi:mRNA interferase MazF